MKKILALLLVLVLAFSCFACFSPTPDNGNEGEGKGEGNGEGNDSVQVMTYAEYIAAPMDSAVVIEAYVQAHQSWWNDKITVYLQDEDGAYFAYEMACTEEQLATLTIGQKIRISGYKTAWAGEVEIVDCSFEVVEVNWIATPADLTNLLGTEELINRQNELALFKGMTVVSVSFKGDAPGDDIYVTLSKGDATYSFCVERYLTAPNTAIYEYVCGLEAGDVVDVVAFLYWYDGPNPHIISMNKSQKSEGAMTYLEYINAPIDSEVVIEAYVQGHQSWWSNKITVYLQDEDGAYFAYEMTCTEEQLASLTIGQKIRISGYKTAWAGEVEIVDCTFEALEGNWVATPVDLTDKLASENLIHYQNQLAIFKGMTVVSVSFKGDAPGDDIYVTLAKGEETYSFCIERYLTAPDTEVYQAVAALTEGTVVDVTGFVYWYDGINTHITAIDVIPAAE